MGIGAAAADAEASGSTIAGLGASNTSATTRNSDLAIAALATDDNESDATAGSGGVISGNAAVASTSNTTTTTASIGDGANIHAAAIEMGALHNDNYAVEVNAVGAGIANMSGAFASSTATNNVNATVGSNARLYATGYVDIGSSNVFANVGTQQQVQGGGGGVLSGAAADNRPRSHGTSTASIGGSTTIVSGLDSGMADQLATKYDGLTYTGGTDLFANPGRIRLGASSQINANDTVSLDSGGAVAGAGASDSLTVNVTNNATVGNDDKLLTNGDIGIGTYTQSTTTQSALTHTYGGGALGDCLGVHDGQQHPVGGRRHQCHAAGLRPDQRHRRHGSVGLHSVAVPADTIGQSYVIGLIAIATGSANTNIHSNATTTIGAGANVLGGADISLGSYRGTNSVSAEGTGHGYELGFIPVTSDDSNARADGSEVLALSGNVTAGIYADSSIAIDASGQLTHSTGAPVQVTYSANFSPWNYINNHLAGLTDNTDSSGNSGVPIVTGQGAPTAPTGVGVQNSNVDDDGTQTGTTVGTTTGSNPGSVTGNPDDLSVGDILKGTTTSGTTAAYTLGSLYAAGGNVTVHAGSITGSGALTAHGSPSISVTNASADYLVLNDITIPTGGGGAVTFTGSANDSSDTAMHVNRDTSNIAPSITLNNSYTGTVQQHAVQRHPGSGDLPGRHHFAISMAWWTSAMPRVPWASSRRSRRSRSRSSCPTVRWPSTCPTVPTTPVRIRWRRTSRTRSTWVTRTPRSCTWPTPSTIPTAPIPTPTPSPRCCTTRPAAAPSAAFR